MLQLRYVGRRLIRGGPGLLIVHATCSVFSLKKMTSTMSGLSGQELSTPTKRAPWTDCLNGHLSVVVSVLDSTLWPYL